MLVRTSFAGGGWSGFELRPPAPALIRWQKAVTSRAGVGGGRAGAGRETLVGGTVATQKGCNLTCTEQTALDLGRNKGDFLELLVE